MIRSSSFPVPIGRCSPVRKTGGSRRHRENRGRLATVGMLPAKIDRRNRAGTFPVRLPGYPASRAAQTSDQPETLTTWPDRSTNIDGSSGRDRGRTCRGKGGACGPSDVPGHPAGSGRSASRSLRSRLAVRPDRSAGGGDRCGPAGGCGAGRAIGGLRGDDRGDREPPPRETHRDIGATRSRRSPPAGPLA